MYRITNESIVLCQLNFALVFIPIDDCKQMHTERSTETNALHCTRPTISEEKSKAPVSQLVNAEVNSVVVIAVLAPNYTLQVRICECHA